MKVNRNRLVLLAGALAAAVLLGVFLLRPDGKRADDSKVPWGSAAVAATAAGAVFWFKRRGPRGIHRAAGRLQVLEGIRLQPGKSLHLVEADGVRLLLSSSENGIRLVTRLEHGSSEPQKTGEGQP